MFEWSTNPTRRIRSTLEFRGATEYTMIWNFFDFLAGVIPYFGIETVVVVDVVVHIFDRMNFVDGNENEYHIVQ